MDTEGTVHVEDGHCYQLKQITSAVLDCADQPSKPLTPKPVTPKRPGTVSGFNLYVKEGLLNKKDMKQCAEEWHEASDHEKGMWNARAKALHIGGGGAGRRGDEAEAQGRGGGQRNPHKQEGQTIRPRPCRGAKAGDQ
eukprot:NODE_5786_length_611_cov_17.431818_g5622_i0.p1 GENE.NODE_5786_length_611_cov_17.431818_g5622_i0~~NODE_5786_length_611_cov_17.431818_g5622_i0.p1  ORF type:complete len:157 (+),score=29.59 NODE_5786_length_611_cov_17.431818_g5622_i0:60-473(+)